MLGMIGFVPFLCSDSLQFTFKDLKRDRAVKYAEHAVFGQKPKLEYVGEEGDKVSFSIRLDSTKGAAPNVYLPLLTKLMQQHEALPLILGPEYFGKFVIESMNETHRFHNGLGLCLVAEVTLSLKEVPSESILSFLGW